MTATSARNDNWTIDPAHSSVTFSVRHMMVTNVRGEFQKVSGAVTYDPAHPENTTVAASIDVSSINTREAQRDAHLKSPDFLDAEHFPTIEFVSKSARVTGPEQLEISGHLTIHGVTHPVTLEVEGLTHGGKDPFGKQRLGATARTTIKRSDFGMKWNAAIEAGGVLVGDAVKIDLDMSFVA